MDNNAAVTLTSEGEKINNKKPSQGAFYCNINTSDTSGTFCDDT